MAARSNDIRRLLNTKADKVSFKKGAPVPSEGRNGDFTVRTIETKGIKLFVKANGRWYSIPIYTDFTSRDDIDRIISKRPPKYDGEFGINNDVFLFKTTGGATLSSYGDEDITIKTGSSVTGTITITDGNNGAITVNPAGIGNLVLSSGYISIPEPAEKATDSSKVLAWDSATSTIRYREAVEVGIAFDGSTANGLLTYKDADEMTVESELTYDSGVLQLSHATAQLKLAKDANDYATFTIADTGDLTIATVGDGTLDSDLILDADGTISLNADGGQVTIKDDTALHFGFDCDNTRMTMYDDANVLDFLRIAVDANAESTISTTDAGPGALGHLSLVPDGDLILDPASQKVIINATDELYFDGGGDTKIAESSADEVTFTVGGDRLLMLEENGADGNTANFKVACVGFTRVQQTFGASQVISGGGNDTDIDFRHSNKYRVEMTGDITNMNLIFPNVSGNFLLVCTTDGDHDVTNWKVYENDESSATITDVMWAGGSVPAFTSTGIDIVSFYWDANEQEAYGTVSLAFATP